MPDIRTDLPDAKQTRIPAATRRAAAQDGVSPGRCCCGTLNRFAIYVRDNKSPKFFVLSALTLAGGEVLMTYWPLVGVARLLVGYAMLFPVLGGSLSAASMTADALESCETGCFLPPVQEQARHSRARHHRQAVAVDPDAGRVRVADGDEDLSLLPSHRTPGSGENANR